MRINSNCFCIWQIFYFSLKGILLVLYLPFTKSSFQRHIFRFFSNLQMLDDFQGLLLVLTCTMTSSFDCSKTPSLRISDLGITCWPTKRLVWNKTAQDSDRRIMILSVCMRPQWLQVFDMRAILTFKNKCMVHFKDIVVFKNVLLSQNCMYFFNLLSHESTNSYFVYDSICSYHFHVLVNWLVIRGFEHSQKPI